ncbi:MAG: TraC family protein [Bdellovibrionaceae bacterium]|nr:TraC family protein [Pseudobdellovibrionaceae bacterium]
MVSKSLAERLPFWHLDEDLTVFNDGSLGVGFRLGGYDISCASPEEINQFNRNVEHLLVSCPEGIRLQLFYRLTAHVDPVLNKHEEVSRDCEPIYKEVREARINFFRKTSEEGGFFVPEIYLFVRSEQLALKKKKLLEKQTQYEQVTTQRYEQHKEKFLRLVSQLESSLKTCKVDPARLGKEEWFGLVFSYLNFSRSESLGVPALREEVGPLSQSIVSQLLLSDAEIKRSAVQIGDSLFRVLTLKTLPEGKTMAAMVDEFTKLPFHFWISQNLTILNQRKEIEKLELSRRVAHSMASGAKNVSDLESESKLSQIEELLRELLEGSERLVSMDFNVILWASDLSELEEKTDEVLKAFRSLNQAEGLVETLAGFDAFLNAAPSVCAGFRHKKLKSSNAAHLMPLYAGWRGNERPVCVLPNREGSLFAIDPFAKSLPAWNGLVFGQTGSGKSFTLCQLMLQFYGQTPRPRIVWIDNGASSERLLEVLDGEFIDLTLESGICMNMFDLEPGEKEPSSAKIKLILAVLELILKDQDQKGLPKREKALLEEAIFEVYKRSPERIPVLSDLKALLEAHSVREMTRFAQILFSWTGNTAYGKMLDRPTNIRMNKDLVTIEIKGLTNHSELKDILLLLLTSFIQDAAASDMTRPYLMICDEAERFFKSGELSKQFIITCYRTWRKYRASIYCLSQNYRDFLSDPELADALLPNTTNVIILRQRKIDWKDFQEAFDFNDAQVEAVKSLEIVKGKYSEFFYMQDENQAILRLVPEPLSYWICTTDGNDKVRIQEMEQKYPGLPKIEILKKLAFGDTEERKAA